MKAVGSKPGILCGVCKVHKNIVDRYPLSRPIFSAIGTLSLKIVKCLVFRILLHLINSVLKIVFALQKKQLSKIVPLLWALV